MADKFILAFGKGKKGKYLKMQRKQKGMKLNECCCRQAADE